MVALSSFRLAYNGAGLYDRAGLIAGNLTGIRRSNIAKYMNKAESPAWRKTRVIRRRPFRFGWLSSLALKVLIPILSS